MLKRIAIALVMLFGAPSLARATTYYVCDQTTAPFNASDSNSGTSPAATWLHSPGMPNFTGSYTHSPGDHILFCGGGMWHSSSGTPLMGGTLTWNHSGASGNPDYLGASLTFFKGSSFVRPILTMDNAPSTTQPSSCPTFDDSVSILISAAGQSNVTIDNLELTGACVNGATVGGDYISISGGTNLTVSNNYIHGFTLGSGASGGDSFKAIGGATASTNTGSVIVGNVIDNSDGTFGNRYTVPSSACPTPGNGANCAPLTTPNSSNAGASLWAIAGDCYDVHQNVIRHVSNGIECGNTVLVHDNLLEYLFEPLSDNPHGNAFEELGGVSGAACQFYNNITRSMSERVTWWPQCTTATVYGNIWENDANGGGSPDGNCLMLSPQGLTNTAVVTTWSIYGNTFDGTCAGQAQAGNAGTPHWASGSVATFQNNHILDRTGISTGTKFFTINSPSVATVTDNGGEVFQTTSAANGQGYTLANDFSPTLLTNATVGAGINAAALCGTSGFTNDLCGGTTKGVLEVSGLGGQIISFPAIPVIARPVSWDGGAYQLSPVAQVLVGGFQSVIPRPNVRMTNNLLTCANFSCATNGSPPPSPWLTINGCAGCVATNAHIHQTGGLSLLLPNAGTSAATLIQQQVTMPGNGLVLRQSGFALTGPLVSGAFVFQTDGPSTDNTHGGVFPQTTVGMTQPQAIGSSTGLFNTFAPSSNGFFSFERDNWIFPQVHNADSWNVGIRVPNGTNATGNTYVGDLDVSLYGWPVALFPTFPGEPAEGYFFGDRMASVYQCGGPAHNMPTIILGMNCYRAEIEKPANVTSLSSLQLTVLVGTGPGCSGGTPAVTGSGSTPVLNLSVTASVIPIAVDGSAWTVESTPTTPHRVCTTLFDSQNSITYTWPDYVLYDVGVAFYSTFNLWPNVDQSLVRMGQPFYIHGVYDDPSGTYNYGSATAAINWSPGNLCPGQSTATLSWTNCIGGIGDLFASPISPVWTNPSPPGRTTAIYTPLGPNWITDLKKHHYNTYLGYAWVTQNPTPGTSDAFGGLWDTMGGNGITYGVELNAWHGTLYCLGWVDAACDIPAAPSAVTVNSTGGTIAAPSTCTPNCYWWIETAPGGWNAIGQGGDEPLYGLSSAPTVSTAVTGSTNSVGVTFASCAGRQDWTLIGGAWSTSNVTQPSPDAFQPIHDPNTTGPPECPANSVTLIGSQTTSSADTGDSNQVGYFPSMMPANDATSGDVPILCLGNNNPPGIGCTTSSCVGGSCGTVAVNIVAQCMSPTKLTIPSNQIGVAAGVTVTAPTCPGSGFTVVYFSIASNPAHLTSPLSWPKFTLIQQPSSPITAGSGTFVVPAFASAVQAQEIPTDLSANGPAASWMNGLSQSQVLAEVAYTFCQGGDATNFPNATKSAGILYPWDEADPQTKANMQAQLLGTGGMKSYCPGAMTFGAVSPGAYWMGRYYMDFAGSDPYDYGISGGGEVFWQGTSCRTAPRYGGTYNTVTPPAANCSTAANISLPQITDATTRALLTESYATRPLMIVDMNFQRVGAQHGFVAHELFLSSMRHIFEGWEAGVNTCCNFWWQRNDMGLFVQQYGNTQAEADTLLVDNEIEDLADVRFQPIVDSTFTQNLPGMFEPGLTTIVSNVEYFAADGSGNPITTAVACNIPAVANNFTDTTQYPYGAGKMWTKYSNQPSAVAPDQRAGFVWSCGGPNSNSTGGVAVFMRVTSPNLPPGQTKISVRWEGRTITIGNNATCPGVTLASNQWCDGWNPVTSTDTISDFDVHLYDIDQVRHNRGTGSINGTGSIQTQ